MDRHFFILTGASRGMGLAMAKQLIAKDHVLLCIARAKSLELEELAAAKDAILVQWSQDLAEPLVAAERLEEWLTDTEPAGLASATLINNAGMVPGVAPIERLDSLELAATLRVGLEAPMLLTSAFLRATAKWSAQRRVLNISSGLGRRAMASQAAYCAAKAGLDHFSRCVALEQEAQEKGARICSLAPGVIDTDMQDQLRSADGALFADRDSFIGLKDQGQLATPQEAAARVLAYLAQENFGSNAVADVRDV
ncbi:MAG: SDR family NAD(P)-dependent oxidoreductase [Burkholderiales bacterium]